MAERQRIAISVERRKKLEHYELIAGDIRVGSAAHCDVRLAPDEAAAEQLSIEACATGVRVRNLDPEAREALPARLDGAPLGEAVVSEGATIELGPVLLTLQLLAAAEPPKDAGKSLLRRVRQAASLIGVGVSYYLVLHQEPRASAFDRALTPPQLFAALSQTSCRYADPPTAEALADQQLRAADGKRERSPYSMEDGIQAVPLYAEAAACYRTAGKSEPAAESLGAAQALAGQLQDDLHAHQVRLEWALGRKRYETAAQELVALRALTAGRNDAHAQWLAALARELRGSIQTHGK
jgi:hypothetical protein